MDFQNVDSTRVRWFCGFRSWGGKKSRRGFFEGPNRPYWCVCVCVSRGRKSPLSGNGGWKSSPHPPWWGVCMHLWKIMGGGDSVRMGLSRSYLFRHLWPIVKALYLKIVGDVTPFFHCPYKNWTRSFFRFTIVSLSETPFSFLDSTEFLQCTLFKWIIEWCKLKITRFKSP